MAGVNTQAKEAGLQLRRIRYGKEYSQEDVARESARRFGVENTISTAQLSRIEGGKFDRVTLDDAVRLGELYGMTPNQMATLYGLWNESPGRPEPEEIVEARRLAMSLPEDLRDQLLHWVGFAVAVTRDEARRRLRTDADENEHPSAPVHPASYIRDEDYTPPLARDPEYSARLKRAKPGDLSFAREAQTIADLPDSHQAEAIQNSPIPDKGALLAMVLRVSEQRHRATLDAERDIMQQSGSEPAVPRSKRNRK